MGFFDVFRSAQSKFQSSIDEEYFYGLVANEISNGLLSPGLAAKALAEANGDKQKADGIYIRLRAGMLKEERAAIAEQEARMSANGQAEINPNTQTLIDSLLREAEQGHSGSQYKLGLRYERGDGLQKDLVTAAGWYLKAADQGHGPARDALVALEKKGVVARSR